jgi:translation elongation factor EF-Tu-like GTPase
MPEIPSCRITAMLHLLPTSEGGRKSAIKARIYRPQFHIGTKSASCQVDGIDRDRLYPGHDGNVTMTVLHPERFGSDFKPGVKFDIWEGTRIVGSGVIKDVITMRERSYAER